MTNKSLKLLDFIAKPESNGDWNAVWGGIKKKDRPRMPLVKMTIKQVLDWQDSIDSRYNSEAAGRYQIMEDTLRPLYRQAGFAERALFNKTNQNKLALQLLKRRGWDEFQTGEMTLEAFALSLAKEWASLPVVRDTKRGSKAIRKGQSYYAGDGLNMSHVKVDDFVAVLESCLIPDTPFVPDLPPAKPKPHRTWFQRLVWPNQ